MRGLVRTGYNKSRKKHCRRMRIRIVLFADGLIKADKTLWDSRRGNRAVC
ncbi:hypothetical protein HMPREF0080_02088 [Anaeroglobus geminatus F0357]|uniref:Uncharacterized protein n=1 Tax=Anaeroglobus geminatus F0357 TaxID=861450 RepID=G9YK78_9FIRM|nr:hypothetical protein HMPREF0080_02088 [Anaeroglobus geminatus F0357]